MKKCIILVALLLLTVMLFSSCAGVVDAGKFYKNYSHDTEELLRGTSVRNNLQNMEVDATGDYLVAMSETTSEHTVISVYNVRSNKEIWRTTVEDGTVVNVDFKRVFEIDLIVVNTRSTLSSGEYSYLTELFDDTGDRIAEAKKEILASTIKDSYDLFQFDKAIYRISPAGAVTVQEKSSLNMELPAFNFYNGEYYAVYFCETTGSEGRYRLSAEATVYDMNLAKLVHWTPSMQTTFVSDPEAFLDVLNDGTLLFQYRQKLPALATDYDYADVNGDKYDLVTKIVKPEKGKEKEIKAKYKLVSGADKDFQAIDAYVTNRTYRNLWGVHKAYDNYVKIYYIDDEQIYSGEHSARYVALNNKGKIKGELFSDLPLIGDHLLRPTSDGNFYYVTTDNTYVLINDDGEKIAEAHDYNPAEWQENANFYIHDGILYDRSLSEDFDFGLEGYKLEKVMDYGVLLSKNGALYLHDGNLTRIFGAEDGKSLVTATEGYYVIYDSGAADSRNNYTYYNAEGDKLFSSDYPAQEILYHRDSGVVLFRYRNADGNVVYVRVASGA